MFIDFFCEDQQADRVIESFLLRPVADYFDGIPSYTKSLQFLFDLLVLFISPYFKQRIAFRDEMVLVQKY